MDGLDLCEQSPSPGDAFGLPAWSLCPAEGPGSSPPVTVFPVLMVSDSLLVLASSPSPGGSVARLLAAELVALTGPCSTAKMCVWRGRLRMLGVEGSSPVGELSFYSKGLQ